MGSNMRNLIEYNGISSCSYGELAHFRQMNTEFTFCVPTQKPDIEQIIKVWVNPCILNFKVIKTPKGTSLEGQNITGNKLMIQGDIQYKVEYVALEAEQSIHTAHTTIPFCGYVVLPEKFNKNAFISASVEVEDIHSDLLDTRCIYNNITLMLSADLC